MGNTYNKLIKNFKSRLIMYTNSLKEKSENKSYNYENLKIYFEYVREEWRVFDKLITEMFSYELLTEKEYGKIHQDGYKIYKEYFDICSKVIIDREE